MWRSWYYTVTINTPYVLPMHCPAVMVRIAKPTNILMRKPELQVKSRVTLLLMQGQDASVLMPIEA